MAEATQPYHITVYRHLCTHALLFKCQHGQDKGATAQGRQMYNTPKKNPGYEKETTRLPQTTNLFSGRRDRLQAEVRAGQGFEKKVKLKKHVPPLPIFAELFFSFLNLMTCFVSITLR